MAQTVLITLTTAGADTGPFSLYSDADGYVSAFETSVAKSSLVAGYTSNLVPDLATIVRVQSTNLCTNYVDLTITGTTTTTTTAPISETVTISLCGAQQASGTGNVVVYAYASAAVNTTVTVDVTWTAADLSFISGTVTISATTGCGTAVLGGADSNETGASIAINSISPGSFGTQTYVSGPTTLSTTCASCPVE